jgi:hypothetical protein
VGELAEFIRRVWDPGATGESVLAARAEGAARNVAEPGVAPPTWIALQAGKALGYVTTIPTRLWDGQREWPAYWMKGLMVLPEFRSGPIGYLVLKAAVASLPRSGGLAVASPARRLFEALGYRDLGAVPNWVRPIAPHRILARVNLADLGLSHLPGWVEPVLRFARRTGLGTVGGVAGGAALRATAWARRFPAGATDGGSFDPTTAAEEIEGLWQAARGLYHSAVVRNGFYLLHRYGSEAGSPYVWLAVRNRGALAGVAILRRPRSEGDERLKGIRVATLADVLFRPDRPNDGLALLGAVERAARDFGADAILAMASAPALGSLLGRQWYLPLSGNVHFLFRDVAGEGPAFGQSLAEWWLARGDGQADEVF